MPTYIFALASAVLWALSAPVLNAGLSRMPQQTFSSIIPGLLVSLTAGTLVLGVVAYPIHYPDSAPIQTFLAGIFTYPIATGLYYMSGFAFGTRAEFAAQFAKIKPLFSTLIAVFILGEAINTHQTLPLILMIVGISLFYFGVFNKIYSRTAVVLGLMTAIAWAIGEAFVKVAFKGSNTIDQSFIALAAGTVTAWLVYLICRQKGLKSHPVEFTCLWPFAVHGILSFGLAYTLFFHSIAVIGLYPTVLVNAFWPFLSMVVVNLFALNKNRAIGNHTPLMLWLASGLLLMASLIEIFLLIQGS